MSAPRNFFEHLNQHPEDLIDSPDFCGPLEGSAIQTQGTISGYLHKGVRYTKMIKLHPKDFIVAKTLGELNIGRPLIGEIQVESDPLVRQGHAAVQFSDGEIEIVKLG